MERETWLLVECGLTGTGKRTSLSHFGEKLGVKNRLLFTLREDQDLEDPKTGVRILPAGKFLMALADGP